MLGLYHFTERMAGNAQYCQSIENYKYIKGDFTMEIKEAKEILNKAGYLVEFPDKEQDYIDNSVV